MDRPSSNTDAPAPQTVSLLGCGWLGLPLAERLVKSSRTVMGSTTRVARLPVIASVGAEPLLMRIDGPDDPTLKMPWQPSDAAARFFASTHLVVGLPPSVSSSEDYVKLIECIVGRLQGVARQHVIFVSSTSVYGKHQGEVNELTLPAPDTENGATLLAAENELRRLSRQNGFALTIVRPAGLIGPGRHPGVFLSGRRGVADPDAPINLVHQLDAVNALLSLITEEAPTEIRVFNLVSRDHTARSVFYTEASRALNLDPPEFTLSSPADANKIIHGESIRLKTEFIFDDLVQALGARRL